MASRERRELRESLRRSSQVPIRCRFVAKVPDLWLDKAEVDMCKAELGIDKGFCEAPGLGEFASANYGPVEGSNNGNHNVLHSYLLKNLSVFICST
ncbi:hypothetical protein RJT34_22552 [Clitoria ternatea]|uniref:Uncharacterized protein n=1 Tax=Clitoria ternatea TaxID=43366 RepID=A0AAN9IFN9_CLITE